LVQWGRREVAFIFRMVRTAMASKPSPALSVVVPVLNEEENVGPLLEGVRAALDANAVGTWELIIVDDGSTDDTAALVVAAARMDSRIRLFSLARRYGQSTAMQVGFDYARAPVVVTMDGDLQNDPRDIPRLVGKLEEGYDLVAGYREKRQDLLIRRRLPSWIANRIIAAITGVPIRDNGCSLKAYRSELLDRINLYSDMHRFIPAMAAGVAGARIAEAPVRHHPRLRGESKYGLSRVGKVLADLLAVKMIRSFRVRPFLMFGAGALGCTLVGAIFGAFFLLAVSTFEGQSGRSVVFAAVSMLWLSLGLFLLMLGLVGEVAVSERHRRAPEGGPLLREVAP
jgi:glycosyltransferase involved in cell wall biosynthesis